VTLRSTPIRQAQGEAAS